MPAKLIVQDTGWSKKLASDRALSGSTLLLGVDESARYDDGTPVALVGAIHEYGLGVPMRPWLTQTWEALRADAQRVSIKLAQAKTPQEVARLKARAVAQLQPLATSAFDSINVEPLAPATVLVKGSSKALVDTGQLRAAVKVWIEEARR